MDLSLVSTYHNLFYLVKREKELFVKANNLKKFDRVQYLLWMNYIIERRGHCYDADIAYLKKTKINKLPMLSVRRMLYVMKGEKLVDYVRSEKLHPVLKRRYIITEQGYRILDNYTSLFTKAERDISYLLKKVHTDADKLIEKD